DSDLSFPMWGAMGQAAMMGLGLALAQPKRRVLVVTGDGEMLMGIGSLATIGVQQPANLTVLVIDNERYGETGMQRTHTAGGVDEDLVLRMFFSQLLHALDRDMLVLVAEVAHHRHLGLQVSVVEDAAAVIRRCCHQPVYLGGGQPRHQPAPAVADHAHLA